MIELKGKYNKDCKVFAEDLELEAITLIQSILDQPVSDGVQIRIMPDVHSGKGIVIGFTMPITSMLNPNHIGVDIGCGMLSSKFSKNYNLNLPKINSDIKNIVPMGFRIHDETVFKNIPFNEVQEVADKFIEKYNKIYNTSYTAPVYNEKWLSKKLKDIDIDELKFWNSIGTLGGGNHFIEIGIDSNSDYWITVHTGSRNFGLKIADYWNNIARSQMIIPPDVYAKELDDIKMNTYPTNLIPKKIQELKDKYKVGVNKEYLQGDNMIGYIFDMIFAQKYAEWNRMTIMNIIKSIINIEKFEEIISTVHNYIDPNDMIIRKGSVASYKGNKLIIPFNQRDGILLCEGKSNPDWNFSGPHGAGRKWSRSKAKEMVTVEQVKKSMKGIYTTSICKETLDESVFAYKNSSMIEKSIEPTATILDRIRPILNIKDTGFIETFEEKKDLNKNKIKIKSYKTEKEKDIRRIRKETRKALGKF